MNTLSSQSAFKVFAAQPLGQWLHLRATERPNVFVMGFVEHHIGNPLIRSIHGGAVGTLIEVSAELGLAHFLASDARVELQSSAIDYIRVTRDTDLYARVELVRMGRRLAFVDVWCWQDREDTPVARGSCTLRVFSDETAA